MIHVSFCYPFDNFNWRTIVLMGDKVSFQILLRWVVVMLSWNVDNGQKQCRVKIKNYYNTSRVSWMLTLLTKSTICECTSSNEEEASSVINSSPSSLNSFCNLWKFFRTFSCISIFSYRSSPYCPRVAAIRGSTFRKITKSGRGRPRSGLLHHSQSSPYLMLVTSYIVYRVYILSLL